MSSIFDHGNGKKHSRENARAKALVNLAPVEFSAQPLSSPPHPALVNLVRLLAREAAAAWLAGEGDKQPTQENSNDKT